MGIVIKIFIIIGIILITFEVLSSRKKSKAAIAKAHRTMNFSLGLGGFWLVFCLVYLWFFIDALSGILYLFDGEHIKNAFQLFDLDYLKDLENYFIEKQMISKAIDIIFYRNSFFRLVTWIIISSINSFMYLYRGFQRQRVFNDKIMTYKGNYKWENILEYKWSEEMNYYSLNIKAARSQVEAKLLNDDISKIKLRFSSEQRKKVDKLLRENIHKT